MNKVFIALGLFSVAIIAYIAISKSTSDQVAITTTPEPSISASISPSPSLSSTPSPTKTPVKKPTVTPVPPTPTKRPDGYAFQTPVPRELIKGPATCQLSGSFRIMNENLYETVGAKITYQNVDDPIRLIYWKASPDDGAIKVGPSLFEGLALPNGSKEPGISPLKPITKTYTLTAMIDYGWPDAKGIIIAKKATCSGSISVTPAQ